MSAFVFLTSAGKKQTQRISELCFLTSMGKDPALHHNLATLPIFRTWHLVLSPCFTGQPAQDDHRPGSNSQMYVGMVPVNHSKITGG